MNIELQLRNHSLPLLAHSNQVESTSWVNSLVSESKYVQGLVGGKRFLKKKKKRYGSCASVGP